VNTVPCMKRIELNNRNQKNECGKVGIIMKTKMSTKKLVQTGAMLALALVFQIGFASFSQVVVGPLVNMVLFVTAAIVSPLSAVMVGVVTPLIAFLIGMPLLFPVVPVIAVGNCILVVIFSYFYHQMNFKYSPILGILSAAFLKFIFLATSIRLIVPLFVPQVPGPLIIALSFNQFITATIGGILALALIKPLNYIINQKK